MTDVQDIQVGDRVRLTRDLPVAGAGTEGVVQKVVRDDQQQVTGLVIFVAGDSTHTFGTTVFPREVEVVERAEARDTHNQ
jgi:hypothetical protein